MDSTKYSKSFRIYEILEHSRKKEWRYVSTKDNPADEGTRGLPASKIQVSSWIKDPLFLVLTEEHWPTKPTSIPIPTELLPNLTGLYCNSLPKLGLIDYSKILSWRKFYQLLELSLLFGTKKEHSADSRRNQHNST